MAKTERSVFYVFSSLVLVVLVVSLPSTVNANSEDFDVNDSSWLDLTCHRWYDSAKQKLFKATKSGCKEGEKLRTEVGQLSYGTITDFRGCVLWRLKALKINNETGSSDFDVGANLRKSLHTIFLGLYYKYLTEEDQAKQTKFIDSLLKKTEECKTPFQTVTTEERLPSPKWGRFYNCIENAWKCESAKQNSQKVQEPSKATKKRGASKSGDRNVKGRKA